MKVIQAFCLILSILMTSAGCSGKPLPDIPDVGVSTDQLNRDLRLIAFPTFNTFKIGDSVTLEVRLESDIEVEISPDLDSQIFVLNPEVSQWVKVNEVPDMGVFESQTFVLSLQAGSIEQISVSVFPDLPDKSEPVDLLIIVTGNILQGGEPSNFKTGAYIIVKLEP